MLEYDRIDASKSTGQRECLTWHYCSILEINVRFQLKVCDSHFEVFFFLIINNVKTLYCDRFEVSKGIIDINKTYR